MSIRRKGDGKVAFYFGKGSGLPEAVLRVWADECMKLLDDHMTETMCEGWVNDRLEDVHIAYAKAKD